MFDNILFQNAGLLLEEAVTNGILPGAVLFSGPSSSGKLSAALELARVLSCRAEKKGEWTCSCISCRQHKSLASSDVLLAGHRDCSCEIAAAKHALYEAVKVNAPYVPAVRYLFIRSIRKLTLRFSPVLWDGDDKLSKIAGLTSAINEMLEEIDFPRSLPEWDALTKLCDSLEKKSAELESDYMYESIPIMQVRNASAWAHLSSGSGRKVMIIENAECMLEGVRNALLKILEEPPENVVFILTTSNKSAVMPTILSRVRIYNFVERTGKQQAEVISRVFHGDALLAQASASGRMISIERYLQNFLPFSPEFISQKAGEFMAKIASAKAPDSSAFCKELGKFALRPVFSIFLEQCLLFTKKLLTLPQGTFACSKVSAALRTCQNNVLIYNQSPQSALEQLVRELLKINAEFQGIFSCIGL
ncbi:MAG: DNA polymerase III [Treponema sp.]|nr:DNA polymerase III [Treponema sp.]